MGLTPNDQLRALLAEARLNGAALARAVNQLAAENDTRLTYGRAAASQWLQGAQPRRPAPQLIAEVLSRRLHRPITAEAAGFKGGHHGADRPSPQCTDDPLQQIADLAPSPSQGDQEQRTLIYNTAALHAPAWDEITTSTRPQPCDEPTMHVGRAEVAAASAMAEVFTVSGALTGAGSVRPALSAYLNAPVTEWLRSSVGTRVRPALYSAAARLTYLCGCLCFEDELHGAAQRYFLVTLALAVEAGDPIAYAIGLRALSMQARRLGHPRQALRLAQSALSTPVQAPPQTRALLHSEVAVAHAATGDEAGSRHYLRTAKEHLQHDPQIRIAVGTYHQADHAQQQAIAHQLLGERQAAISALQYSIRHRTAAEHCAQTLALADLAELQLACGRLDQAIETWHKFLDNCITVRCGRVRTALDSMRSRLCAYATHPPVHALLGRAAHRPTTPYSGVSDGAVRGTWPGDR
jgi:tetratricopeptide (TPR) repeat protein